MAKKRNKRFAFEPDYAIPPGDTLQETIDALGMNQSQLATRTGMTTKTINLIIKGKAPITHDTAVILERVTGVPARMWNNLESNFREQLAKVADRRRLEKNLKWLRTIPTNELIKRGVLAKSDKLTMLHEVLRFFGVSSPGSWNTVWMKPSASFRKSPSFKAEPQATATWLRLGELAAQEIETQAYDRGLFQHVLQDVRALTTEPPEVFQPEMIRLCAEAGVAVAIIPEIKKSRCSGAARWLDPQKALIQLSARYKSNDHFWFSFFHEAGHILNDAKKEIFINDGTQGGGREDRANRFAADFLIPPANSDQFPMLTTRKRVISFARSIGVSPGIVVGRLQKEKVIAHSYLNDLKKRFSWSEE